MEQKQENHVKDLLGQVLIGVESYGHPDGVRVDTITFEFESGFISISVNSDEDTVFWIRGKVFPLYEGQVRKQSGFWDNYIGKQIVFLWEMSNQSGSYDAVQFMFSPTKNEYLIAQMIAIASDLILFSLTEARDAASGEEAA